MWMFHEISLGYAQKINYNDIISQYIGLVNMC